MPLTSLVRLTTSPNKLANVCNWHECDMAGWRMDVRFRSKSGHAADISAMTESARSMTRYPPMGGQLHRTHHLVETEQRVGSAVLDSSAPQQSARGPERCSADEYLQKLPAGKPQTALPIIRLQYLPCNLAEEGEGPLVARCVVSLQRHSSDAIGGEADIARTSRTCRYEVTPHRTRSVSCRRSKDRFGVSLGHSAMSVQCPVCPKPDTAGRFMSTRPSSDLI